MNKPNAQICTVGTSMFGRQQALRGMLPHMAAEHLRALLNPADGGAEHQNLVTYCRNDRWIDRLHLHLLHSDTADGAQVAAILQARFQRDFARVALTCCDGLRDDNPKMFAARGLRSLVNRLVSVIEQLRREEKLAPAIDVTGGFKPQIAYATLVGQVMQVPVYYRYEGFEDVIALQPLPITVDPQVWFDHLWFFEQVRREPVADRKIPQQDRRVAPLLDREDHLAVLSPLGELMAAAVDSHLLVSGADLIPPDSGTDPAAKKVQYEDGNPGKHRGLEEFCRRICQAGYVTRVATFYFNRDLPHTNEVRAPADGAQEPSRLEVWYGDGQGLTKLSVWTTASNGKELAAVRADLARRLGAR